MAPPANVRILGASGRFRGGTERMKELLEATLADLDPGLRARAGDIAVSFWPANSCYLILGNLFRRPGRRRIVVAYEHFALDYVRPHWRLARRLLYPFADCVVCVTGAQAAYFGGFAKKVVRIRNATRFRCDPADIAAKRKQIVYAGHLRDFKRVGDLVDAAADLGARLRREGWDVLIVGRGAEEDALRSRIAERQCGDVVSLLGYRDDVEAILRGARIFVLPSEKEAAPVSVIEALACGAAVVCAGYGAHAVAEFGGLPGVFFYAPRDVGQLAGHLGALVDGALSGEAVAAGLGLASLESATRFSEDAYRAAWFRLIRELVEARGPKPMNEDA